MAFINPLGSAVIQIGMDLQKLGQHLATAGRMIYSRLHGPIVAAGKKAAEAFGKAFNTGLRTAMNAVGATLIRRTRQLATTGVMSAFKFGKFGVGVAAEMEQAEISMQTLLDSMEQGSKLFKDVRNMALETPFEFPELRDAAKLLAVKVPQSGIVPALKMLGDLASGTGGDIKELAFAYEKIFGSERIQNYWLRMFERRGLPIYKELSKQLNVSQTQVFEMARKGEIGFKQVEKALLSMTQAGGAFFGMTDRLSTSLLGQFNKLKDSVKELGRQVGESLRHATELLTQGAMVMLPKLGQWLNKLFGGLTDERLLRWAETLATVIGDLVDELKQGYATWREAQAGLALTASGYMGYDETAKGYYIRGKWGKYPTEDAKRQAVKDRASAARDLVAQFPDQWRLSADGTKLIDIPAEERKHKTRNTLKTLVDEMGIATNEYRAKKKADDAEREKAQKERYHSRVMDSWQKSMGFGPYANKDKFDAITRFFKALIPGAKNTAKAGGLGLAMAGMNLLANASGGKKKSGIAPVPLEGGFRSFEELNRSIQETLLGSTQKKIEKNTAKTNSLLESAGGFLSDLVKNTKSFGALMP